MNDEEKKEWLEGEISLCVRMKNEYALRESLSRKELDKLFDKINNNGKI
jgi:hypothetical protein